jgi:hypothetical protein
LSAIEVPGIPNGTFLSAVPLKTNEFKSCNLHSVVSHWLCIRNTKFRHHQRQKISRHKVRIRICFVPTKAALSRKVAVKWVTETGTKVCSSTVNGNPFEVSLTTASSTVVQTKS